MAARLTRIAALACGTAMPLALFTTIVLAVLRSAVVVVVVAVALFVRVASRVAGSAVTTAT
eukprot:5511933-Alexandrium_andersonii.AAC.1